jgi:hypothetical protein
MAQERTEDLEKVNDAIARAKRELEKPDLHPEVRSKLERELEIFEHLQLTILLDPN